MSKPSHQPFLMLPPHFLLMGMLVYVGLEILGSSALLYIEALQGRDQMVIISMRLMELLTLLTLIHHFDLFKSLGLGKPKTQAVLLFLKVSAVCVLFVGLLYVIQPSLFLYIAVPKWLFGLQGLLLMVVIAPVVEELVFRGLLYRMLRERWGIVISVAVSAVFFSLLHHGMIVSPQLAGGIIFALAYEWSRSLWVAIALHMGANSAVYLLSVLDFAN